MSERDWFAIYRGSGPLPTGEPGDDREILEVEIVCYSAAAARDGAMNQATTRIAKTKKAAAITSWLLRLNQWDLDPVHCLEVYLGNRRESVARGWTIGNAQVTPGLPFGTGAGPI
ncbi:MAG: hypothetical protein ABSC46_02700 [Candidatus Limnocylindrales bacterium]|jgi:hypothetical protein